MINIIKKLFTCFIIIVNANLGITGFNITNSYKDNIVKYNNIGVNDNEVSSINCLNGFLVPSINMPDQQRYFKANIIKNINRDLDRITVGSSHMLTIRYNDSNIDHINLAIGGANLKDRLCILGLLHYFNINYKFINLELDIPSFTDNAFNINQDYDFLDAYGDYFLNVINNEDISDFEYVDFNKNYENKYTYLGYDLYYKTNDISHINDLFYYDKEASQHIPKNIEDGIEEWIEKTIIQVEYADLELKNMHINKKSIDVYNKLFNYFKNKNVEVNIVLVPRSPMLYDRENMKSYPIVNEIMEYAFSISKNKNIPITGSLNPHFIDAKDEYYFDGFHLNQEITNSIFDIRRLHAK